MYVKLYIWGTLIVYSNEWSHNLAAPSNISTGLPIGPVSNDSSPLKCLHIHRVSKRIVWLEDIMVIRQKKQTYQPLSSPPLRKLQSQLLMQSHPPPTPLPPFQSGTRTSVSGTSLVPAASNDDLSVSVLDTALSSSDLFCRRTKVLSPAV